MDAGDFWFGLESTVTARLQASSFKLQASGVRRQAFSGLGQTRPALDVGAHESAKLIRAHCARATLWTMGSAQAWVLMGATLTALAALAAAKLKPYGSAGESANPPRPP